MKPILTSLLLTSALTTAAFAGPAHSPPKRAGLQHYVLFDVGSFGGGYGDYSNPATRSLNRHGDNVGVATTDVDDPFCPDWCFIDGHIGHAFQWQDGVTTDLGALQDGVNSFGLAINDKGLIAGLSQNGTVDPDTGAPEARAVIWKGGKIKDLGTLGGAQSSANASVNNFGQVAIASTNSDSNDAYINVPQANCLWLVNNGTGCGQNDFAGNALFVPVSTQTHAAIWSKADGLKDLGTLGGPDSNAYDINDAGQVVGWSYTSSQAGASGVPDTHPFIWDEAHGMQDMGTLGGTFAAPVQINKNGEVTGASNLAGDTVVHTFIWDKDHGMQDVPSFGGWYSHPNWINDKGDVVGISSYADDTRHAFYWHDETIHDLGTIAGYERSVALSISNNRAIVGYAFSSDGSSTGFVSSRGRKMADLNTLVDNSGDAFVLEAYYIDEHGEITGVGALPDGEVHPVVLVPDTDVDRLAQMKAAMSWKSAQRGHHGGAISHARGVPKRMVRCGPRRGPSRSCAER